MAIPDMPPDKKNEYLKRINDVEGIRRIELHIEEVTGEEKTVDVVVDIFNQVNSGGTKLSKGDLALARICAMWPDARDEMKKRLDKWRNAGFNFKLDWLLRCINTIMTGEALFSALKDIDTQNFKSGLLQAEKYIDRTINMISSRLGLDHDRVLGSRYSFPLIVRYLEQSGGVQLDSAESDKLLFWYIHTFLWGRYAGSTESILNQDLALIEETGNALDRLLGGLRQNRGDLRLNPSDFMGWSKGARFYPLLYMLTRVFHAKDWGSGLELSQHMLGRTSSLELHHIFPKDKLKNKYGRPEINAIANFTFLTKETNLIVTNRDPDEYMEEFIVKHPGAVESHWIPLDRDLWKIENYPDFLSARRELLANAANEFLSNLVSGTIPGVQFPQDIVSRVKPATPGSIHDEDEESLLLSTNEWTVQKGLPEGEFEYELTNPETGELLAIIDLAWPEGIQEGYSDPVALLIDETPETIQIVNLEGYKCFIDVDSFKAYVEKEIIGV